jgi:FkbM family methyltransferase
MMQTFIDCGTNLGQGLLKIMEAEHVDKTWNVHSFEANPFTFRKINRLPNVTYYNKAISDKNEIIAFNCELHPESDDYIGGGSSIHDADNWVTERVYGQRFDYKRIRVSSIDLGQFMVNLNLIDRSCVIKMDIEGSEYKVLDRLLNLGMLSKVSRLYIEFHDHLFVRHPSQYNADKWIEILSNNGVKVLRWY